MEKIHEIIKTKRNELGLTQQELARLIGTKRGNIAKYETGRAMPPGDTLLKIMNLKKAKS